MKSTIHVGKLTFATIFLMLLAAGSCFGLSPQLTPPCGVLGLPCCQPGNHCQGGFCDHGACSQCGGNGQMCCPPGVRYNDSKCDRPDLVCSPANKCLPAPPAVDPTCPPGSEKRDGACYLPCPPGSSYNRGQCVFPPVDLPAARLPNTAGCSVGEEHDGTCWTCPGVTVAGKSIGASWDGGGKCKGCLSTPAGSKCKTVNAANMGSPSCLAGQTRDGSACYAPCPPGTTYSSGRCRGAEKRVAAATVPAIPPCGKVGLPCCPTGSRCEQGFVCDSGLCSQCGREGLKCCPPNNVCTGEMGGTEAPDPNLACVSGRCVSKQARNAAGMLMGVAAPLKSLDEQAEAAIKDFIARNKPVEEDPILGYRLYISDPQLRASVKQAILDLKNRFGIYVGRPRPLNVTNMGPKNGDPNNADDPNWSHYNNKTHTIQLMRGISVSDLIETVRHELGHAIVGHKVVRINTPNGKHSLCDVKGPGLAMSEGWANFVGVVLSPGKEKTYKGKDWDNAHSDKSCPYSIDNEFRVAAILWDIYDKTNERRDEIDISFLDMFGVFSPSFQTLPNGPMFTSIREYNSRLAANLKHKRGNRLGEKLESIVSLNLTPAP